MSAALPRFGGVATALALCALFLVACGNNGSKNGERAPSPSALTEPPPKALGARAASAQPLDGGNVGSMPDPEPGEEEEDDPQVPAPSAPPLVVEPDAGVAL